MPDRSSPATEDPSALRGDPLFVGTLEKGLRVLKAFRQGQREWGARDLNLKEIAQLAGLEKSAAQRLTSTLVKLGYLEKDQSTRRYRPAKGLVEFYYTYMVSNWLAEIAMPRLIAAAKVFDTTVNLAELDGSEIIYTVRIPHQKSSYRTMISGRRMPAFCTAAGVAMLAYRPQSETATILDRTPFTPITEHTITDRSQVEARIDAARERGYDIGVSQAVVNEISTAAPILDIHGTAIGAVQIPVFRPEWTVERVETDIAPLATETARAISGTLLGQR